jgi:hypothetical protein
MACCVAPNLAEVLGSLRWIGRCPILYMGAHPCDDWAWLSLNRRSRQLLVTCGYERSMFFLVNDRGNRVDVCKAS